MRKSRNYLQAKSKRKYNKLSRKINFNQIIINTEVYYFSDHGQSFKSKRLSHCNSLNPDIEEWEIPLLYYKGNKGKKIDINNNLKFYDFVLSMMGFKNSKTTDNKNILFYGSINKRLDSSLKFKEVDLD